MHVFGEDSNDPLTNCVFEDGQRYEVRILLYPADGYRFTEENPPYVNGSWDYGRNLDADYIWIYLGYDFRDPPVEELYIMGLPDSRTCSQARLSHARQSSYSLSLAPCR